MAEENQIQPLAPATIYGKSDEEFANLKPIHNRVRRRSSKCPVYVLAGIVFLGMVILIFCTAILRVETPRVRLHAAAVKSLEYATSPSAMLNATVVAEMSVDNKNFGRFRFGNSTVAVLYGNVTVGGGRISGGRARAREDDRWNVTMEVRGSGGLLRESGNFSGELSEGAVKLWTYAKLVGRIRVTRMVNRKKSAFMNCTMSLHLLTKQIKHLRCR